MKPTYTALDIPSLLSDPSPQDWKKVCLILDELWQLSDKARHTTQPHRMLADAVNATRKALTLWPTDARKNVPREPLDHWLRATPDNPQGHDQLLDLCLKIKHESQTYNYYETYVCNDPKLLWTTDGPWGKRGCQQCHLVRGFSGPARSVRSESWLRIGEPGQGDLVGWLSVFLPPYGLLAVKLELEIKMPSGVLSKSQRARRDELARAGAIYLSAKSVKSAVSQVVAVRDALLAKRPIAQAVEEVEGLGW